MAVMNTPQDALASGPSPTAHGGDRAAARISRDPLAGDIHLYKNTPIVVSCVILIHVDSLVLEFNRVPILQGTSVNPVLSYLPFDHVKLYLSVFV